MMKKRRTGLFHSCLLFLLLLAMTGCRPEGSGVQKEVFDQWEGKKGVYAFSLPPGLFALIIGHEEPAFRDMVQGLDKIRVILIDRGAGRDPEKDFLTGLTELGYEDLLQINNGEDRVRVKVYEPEDQIREVMVLVSSEDTFMGLSLVGNISEDNLRELVKQIRMEDFVNMK